jgi:hypothetical protein
MVVYVVRPRFAEVQARPPNRVVVIARRVEVVAACFPRRLSALVVAHVRWPPTPRLRTAARRAHHAGLLNRERRGLPR